MATELEADAEGAALDAEDEVEVDAEDEAEAGGEVGAGAGVSAVVHRLVVGEDRRCRARPSSA